MCNILGILSSISLIGQTVAFKTVEKATLSHSTIFPRISRDNAQFTDKNEKEVVECHDHLKYVIEELSCK